MEISKRHTRERMGIALIFIPVSSFVLLLLAVFSNSTYLGFFIWPTVFIIFGSVPFSGLVALISHKSNRLRMKRAIVRFLIGLLLSTLLVICSRKMVENAKEARRKIEMQQQAEQDMLGNGEQAR